MADASDRVRTDPALPLSPGQEYRTLLAVSEAIISHRDLRELFHELAGRLHQMVRFDYLGLVLHDPASQACGCTCSNPRSRRR